MAYDNLKTNRSTHDTFSEAPGPYVSPDGRDLVARFFGWTMTRFANSPFPPLIDAWYAHFVNGDSSPARPEPSQKSGE